MVRPDLTGLTLYLPPCEGTRRLSFCVLQRQLEQTFIRKLEIPDVVYPRPAPPRRGTFNMMDDDSVR